jgi:glutamine synthetase
VTAGLEGALDLIATADLAGVCRGRAVPAGSASSVGWVPANLAINCFATLADNPFGSVGDLRIHADPATAVPLPSSGAPVTLLLGDLRNPDGTEWDCCPRTLLRRTLDELRAETGLVVRASFEHEFVLGSADRPGHPFAVQTMLAGEPFGSQLVAALARAGLEPENWLPEFGQGQWEVTVRPADGLAAADRAILLREIVRAAALVAGRTASFTPVHPAAGATSGAHIHFSLWTADGEPATGGEDEHGLSKTAAAFASGILDHAPAMLAFTAPSVVSYHRLGPGHWSADSPRLAARDREALLRIPAPATTTGAAAHPHLEFRAADSTANPWLALAALVRAGLAAVTGEGSVPADPAVATFPRSLDEALSALERDAKLNTWFPADLLCTYLSLKRAEIDHVADLVADNLYTRYAHAY